MLLMTESAPAATTPAAEPAAVTTPAAGPAAATTPAAGPAAATMPATGPAAATQTTTQPTTQPGAATSQPPEDMLKADLVFEGGGVKGIGLAGAYRTLSDRGYQPQCVAGTSAGAIMASLVAAGYTGAELEGIVLDKEKMDFTKFEDATVLDHAGAPGEIAQFLATGGIHSGKYFLQWIRALLAAKNVATFGDPRSEGEDDPKRQYKLQVIASDLSARSMLVLPRDAQQIGSNPDQLEVAEAIRMSMSIPVFFTPVSVDGHETPPRFPTFGLLLVAPNQRDPLIQTGPAGAPAQPLRSRVDFLMAIAETMMEAHDRFYVEQADYARTIPIPTLGVRTTEFDIPDDRARALFQSGQNAAAQFLGTWDFDKYKRKFRSGVTVTRRETL